MSGHPRTARRIAWSSVAGAGPAFLLAEVAWAADEHAGGLSDLLWPAANLLLLLAVLGYFGRKPIVSFFTDRRSEIQEEVTGAADQLGEAESEYAKWQRRLIGLESELDEIRTTSRHRAEAERERILEDARAAAERIRRDATAAVDQELRRAREVLRAEATQLAIELATERLQREVTDSDRDRLLDEFIERVEGATGLGTESPGD